MIIMILLFVQIKRSESVDKASTIQGFYTVCEIAYVTEGRGIVVVRDIAPGQTILT